MPLHTGSREFRRIESAFAGGWRRDARGIGDDAAVLPDGTVLCCDALAEGVHFRRDWSRLGDVGWKAVAVNVSDVLAMGARPEAAVWSVGMGADWSDRDFRALARGAGEACRAMGVALVGGDTVRTTGAGFVSLALTGRLIRSPWLRSGARPGDRLVLAGATGASAAGMALLQAGLRPRSLGALIASHRRPRPPLEAWRSVARSPRLSSLVHGAIDISDGLSSECHHLAAQSGVRLVLDEETLEPSEALREAGRRLAADPREWVLHGGEDQCLLLAIGPEARRLPAGLRVIGRVEAGAGVFLDRRDAKGRDDGRGRGPFRLPERGWRHR